MATPAPAPIRFGHGGDLALDEHARSSWPSSLPERAVKIRITVGRRQALTCLATSAGDRMSSFSEPPGLPPFLPSGQSLHPAHGGGVTRSPALPMPADEPRRAALDGAGRPEARTSPCELRRARGWTLELERVHRETSSPQARASQNRRSRGSFTRHVPEAPPRCARRRHRSAPARGDDWIHGSNWSWSPASGDAAVTVSLLCERDNWRTQAEHRAGGWKECVGPQGPPARPPLGAASSAGVEIAAARTEDRELYFRTRVFRGILAPLAFGRGPSGRGALPGRRPGPTQVGEAALSDAGGTILPLNLARGFKTRLAGPDPATRRLPSFL